jgi:hypothetical protein
MTIVGIESRATIPLKNLMQFEKEIFSLGFIGSLSAGAGIFPNGIILRISRTNNRLLQNNQATLEFSYPPYDSTEKEISENICNQYSAFFHIIKECDGNPYPFFIKLEETENKIRSYKNLKVVNGIASCSINPLHLTIEDDYPDYYFFPFSVGEVSWDRNIEGPLLALGCELENFKKEIDLRELNRDFSFGEKEINFGIRIVREYKDPCYHFALTGLPQDVLPNLESVDTDFAKVIFYIFHKYSKNSDSVSVQFVPVQDSVLSEVENEIKNLKKKFPKTPLNKIPVEEVISNRELFKSMAKEYLKEKWGVENNLLSDAYALFLSQIDYVERTVQKVDKKLYDVTNFEVVKLNEDWFSALAKKYKINIHHVFAKYRNSEKGIVNYKIELQNFSEKT